MPSHKPVFVDTGPLLLLLVGTYDKNATAAFKRTRKYDVNTYDVLIQFLAARRGVITPGVLAEVSNLAMELKDEGFRRVVEANVSSLRELGEAYVAKDVILSSPVLGRMGVTDVSIFVAAKEGEGEILTDDFHLLQRSRGEGVDATHMMELQSRAELFAADQ